MKSLANLKRVLYILFLFGGLVFSQSKDASVISSMGNYQGDASTSITRISSVGQPISGQISNSAIILQRGFLYSLVSKSKQRSISLTDNNRKLINGNDNILITASFDKPVNVSPTISISGLVTNTIMQGTSNLSQWTYQWDVPNSYNGTATATVSIGSGTVTQLLFKYCISD